LSQAARHLDIDAEAALRDANAKFERRFRQVEGLLAAEGKIPTDVDMQQLEALWVRAKREPG
jgi:ATP diphosphatase